MVLFLSPTNSVSFLNMKEPSDGTTEAPSSWNMTTLSGEHEHDVAETKLKGSTGKKIIDGGDGDEVSSMKMNLTVVSSTLNYTSAQEVKTFYT